MAVKKKNKNIVPVISLDKLKNEVLYKDFEYKEHFLHLCNLIPNIENERLDIEIIDKDKIKLEGMVYVFVIGDKIFKIGHTITSITKRVQSYNCGKVEYRIAGTNSTTNYFILQSFLKINKKVIVYAFFPTQPEYTLFGKKYSGSFPASKRAERVILESFMTKWGRKPIGCTQK